MQGNHQTSAKLSESTPTRDRAVFFEPRPTKPPGEHSSCQHMNDRQSTTTAQKNAAGFTCSLLRLGSFQRKCGVIKPEPRIENRTSICLVAGLDRIQQEYVLVTNCCSRLTTVGEKWSVAAPGVEQQRLFELISIFRFLARIRVYFICTH